MYLKTLFKEDKVLLRLIELKGVKKWNTIAKCMSEEFHINGKTGKQCRDR